MLPSNSNICLIFDIILKYCKDLINRRIHNKKFIIIISELLSDNISYESPKQKR